MVYGSFKYDNRRDYRDDEEASGTIKKGCDDGNDTDDADEEEEANDIIIATADSTRFTLAYLAFLLLMVVLSCFMLGIDFSIGTTTFSSWLLSSSSSLSSSLSLSLSSSSYNNNNIDESVISSTQDLDTVAIATHNNIDTNIGQCQTTGTYSSVIDFKNGGHIGFGKTYRNLSFNSRSYSQQTFVPDRCYWSDPKYHHNPQCPGSTIPGVYGISTKRLVQAWQQCAEACNMDERCLTYTAKVEYVSSRIFHDNEHYSYMCYLHDHYTRSKHGTGIAASEIDIRTRKDVKGYLGFWSGLCRS